MTSDHGWMVWSLRNAWVILGQGWMVWSRMKGFVTCEKFDLVTYERILVMDHWFGPDWTGKSSVNNRSFLHQHTFSELGPWVPASISNSNTDTCTCTGPVSCFLEQFWSGYISFILKVSHNFLVSLCKCNSQETGTTNKIVLCCFYSFCASLQDASKGVIKKFAMIVSYERTRFFLQTLGILTKMSEDYFLKTKRLLNEYQLF